jgi:hypothetical protein
MHVCKFLSKLFRDILWVCWNIDLDNRRNEMQWPLGGNEYSGKMAKCADVWLVHTMIYELRWFLPVLLMRLFFVGNGMPCATVAHYWRSETVQKQCDSSTLLEKWKKYRNSATVIRVNLDSLLIIGYEGDRRDYLRSIVHIVLELCV